MHVLTTWIRWMIFGLILLSAAEVAAAADANRLMRVYKFVSPESSAPIAAIIWSSSCSRPSAEHHAWFFQTIRDRYSPKKDDADLVSGMQPGQFLQAKRRR